MGCQPVAASTKQLRRADGGGRKREGATGSLATLASGRGASHPRSFHHGSQLPTMSRGQPQVAREQTDYTVASTASGIISPLGFLPAGTLPVLAALRKGMPSRPINACSRPSPRRQVLPRRPERNNSRCAASGAAQPIADTEEGATAAEGYFFSSLTTSRTAS